MNAIAKVLAWPTLRIRVRVDIDAKVAEITRTSPTNDDLDALDDATRGRFAGALAQIVRLVEADGEAMSFAKWRHTSDDDDPLPPNTVDETTLRTMVAQHACAVCREHGMPEPVVY